MCCQQYGGLVFSQQSEIYGLSGYKPIRLNCPKSEKRPDREINSRLVICQQVLDSVWCFRLLVFHVEMTDRLSSSGKNKETIRPIFKTQSAISKHGLLPSLRLLISHL